MGPGTWNNSGTEDNVLPISPLKGRRWVVRLGLGLTDLLVCVMPPAAFPHAASWFLPLEASGSSSDVQALAQPSLNPLGSTRRPSVDSHSLLHLTMLMCGVLYHAVCHCVWLLLVLVYGRASSICCESNKNLLNDRFHRWGLQKMKR